MSDRPPIGKRTVADRRAESVPPISARPRDSNSTLVEPSDSFSDAEAATRTGRRTPSVPAACESVPQPVGTAHGGAALAAREALSRTLRRPEPKARDYASIAMDVPSRTANARSSTGSLAPSRAKQATQAPSADEPPATVRRPSQALTAIRSDLRAPNPRERPPVGRVSLDDAAARFSAARIAVNSPAPRVTARSSASIPSMGTAASRVSRNASVPSFGAVIKPAGDTATASTKQADSGARDVRVKGINFTTALDAVQILFGPNARHRVEKETAGALGEALRFGGIVAGGWYSVAWYREFWKSLHDILGVDEAGARRIGHRAARIGVNVAYRALARMSSPAMLLSMSARAFNYYYEPATLSVKQPEPKRLTAEWRGCNGFDSYIWSETEGGATYFIEATGATGVTFSVIAGGGNSNFMVATATWL